MHGVVLLKAGGEDAFEGAWTHSCRGCMHCGDGHYAKGRSMHHDISSRRTPPVTSNCEHSPMGRYAKHHGMLCGVHACRTRGTLIYPRMCKSLCIALLVRARGVLLMACYL